eukprot:TRINITY_DN669_c0_g1_i3.p1 TRINITY_DN669_c0_g1~~TRINITY_DN669_c0_g1_i3.p1  ORF type:complete len:373 (+),score=68.49 TRINITY_DN669_c0_g1_i3:135-1121(+)
MEEEATCPVCLDLLQDPVILSCCHNVCFHCVEKLYASQEKDEDALICPVCRVSTVLDAEGGVQSLKRNLTLRNLIEKMMDCNVGLFDGTLEMPSGTDAASSECAGKCAWCEEANASLECEQCGERYCHECSVSLHTKGRFKQHTVTPINKLTRVLKVRYCPEHEGERLTLFCLEDEKIVCAHCLLVGAHQDHQRTSLRNAFSDASHKLQQAAETLTHKKVEAENGIVMLEDVIQRVRDQATGLQGQVTRKCDALRELIQQREKTVLEKIRSLENACLLKLENRLRIVRQNSQDVNAAVAVLSRMLQEEVGGRVNGCRLVSMLGRPGSV